MPQGKIANWKDDKGFGFITPDDAGKDIFFHHSNLRNFPGEITRGLAVRYTIGQDVQGRVRALDVDLV